MRLRLFWMAIICLTTSHICAQKSLSNQIVASDQWFESQKAYQFLDSVNKHIKLNQTEKLLLLQRIAQRSLEINKYDKLSEFCIDGIKLSRELQNDSLHAYFYKFLGISQVYSKKPEQAIESWKISAEIARQNNLPYIEVTNYNNIGGTLVDLLKYQEAEKYLLKSISLSEKNGVWSLRNKLLSYRILASLYDRTNRLKEVGNIYENVHKIAFELKDTNLICSNMVFHATYLKKIGKIKEAIQKTSEAVRLTKMFGDKNSLMTALRFHGSVLAKSKRFEEAYAANESAYLLAEKIYQENNQNQINELETRFKTQEIEQKKKLAEFQSLAAQRKKNNYFFLLIIVVFISLFVFLILFLRTRNREAHVKLQIQEERLASAIEGQEQERTRIAKELHDGIVQELTAVKMQLSENELEENPAVKEIEKIMKDLRELSYQMMPVTLQQLGLEKALEELFFKSFSKNGIVCEWECFDLNSRLPEKVEVSIYRICQELINNVLKHANANRVHVVLRKKANVLTIIFEDNGVGFDINNQRKGIGLASLQSRLELLRGNIEFDSSRDAGTTAFIRIPIHNT